METFKEWFKEKFDEDPAINSVGICSTLNELWDHQQQKTDKALKQLHMEQVVIHEQSIARRDLDQKIDELAECVEFYADKNNWEIPDIDSRGFDGMSAKSVIEIHDTDNYINGFNGGKRARKCLEKHNEISTTGRLIK